MLGPLFFRLLIAVGITGAAGGTYVWRLPTFIVFVALEAAWSLVEGFLARAGQVSTPAWQSGDPRQIPWVVMGKRYLLARTLYHAVLLAYFAAVGSLTAAPTDFLAVVGIALMLAAIGLRAWSMQTLGERFRSFEVRTESQGLETGGPYAVVRHPGYLAMILFDLGMPLLLNSILLLPFFFIPLAVLMQRVDAEEALLEHAYPVDYPEYVTKTWRIVPRVY